MKRKTLKILYIALVLVLIAAVIALYLYEVLYVKKPYTENLFRAVLIVVSLLIALYKVVTGYGRKPLRLYESLYAKEIGDAFGRDSRKRRKLLCACRFYDEGKNKKAVKTLFELRKVAKGKNEHVSILLFIALCYTKSGFNAEAIKAYDELLTLDPNHAQAHSNLGARWMAEGDFQKALQYYHRSIELRPNYYAAYVNRANCYFYQGEFDNAIVDAKQALEYKNNGHEAASLLAIIYALQGDEGKKQRYYHISVSSGKDPRELSNAIQYYLNERHIPSDEE